jgi:hypothetical protein
MESRPQGADRINARGAARGKEAGNERNGDHHDKC